MSERCAEWPRLRAELLRRLERDGDGPVLGSAIFDHLESCAECRSAALRLDPTLALRPLYEERAPGSAEDPEVVAMRQAVETLRRARPARRPRLAGWRVAAAALLVAGALYQLPLPGRRPGLSSQAALDAQLEALAAQSQGRLAADSTPPAIEDLDRPDARVYQLGGGDVAVVMIVDETLDV